MLVLHLADHVSQEIAEQVAIDLLQRVGYSRAMDDEVVAGVLDAPWDVARPLRPRPEADGRRAGQHDLDVDLGVIVGPLFIRDVWPLGNRDLGEAPEER